ncbi:hypothetical protein I5E68_09610 [Novosphingobium sp. YJ-S2-02]|uniref:Uncharacterized protein n=1 Tax=Novosphingobium aureum TaxID=2792964 RepID=A0A931MLL6_9SPHN|nr:hypothetical protein [Novosphingobium aureum]MBH0113201.1 hypothetical protein [Novosphingobium aureum]
MGSDMPLQLTVQTVHPVQFSPLNGDDRRFIDETCKPHINLSWLPAYQRSSDLFDSENLELHANYGIDISVIIGLGVGFAANSFFGAMLKEAGKDTYNSLKSFLASIAKRSAKNSYRVRPKVVFLLEIDQDFVAFIIPFHNWIVTEVAEDNSKQVSIYLKNIENHVQAFHRDWSKIIEQIQGSDLNRSGLQYYVSLKGDYVEVTISRSSDISII